MAMHSNVRVRRPSQFPRRGSIAVLSAVLLVVIAIFTAVAIDVGYMCLVKAEAQRCADSAALAAGWDIVGEERLRGDLDAVYYTARTKAIEYAALNKCVTRSPYWT